MHDPDDILDRIARSGDAVMAIDYGERVILWNKGAERLFGRPARSVLGKPCYEIMGGRDVHGNLYCYRACPVAHQARDTSSEPVHSFPLEVKTGSGKAKQVDVTMFAIPNSRPSLSTIVHVFRETTKKPSVFTEELAEEAAPPAPPLFPLAGQEPATITLTPREKQILRCLAEGLATPDIARRLSISRVTVRNHVQNVLQKLDVHNKLAAVAFAHQHGLV
ncbi:MAG: LuxR C-terminal-related transcriptional regulator [Thermoanaerobaculia bacterium]